ncbi:AMP-binding protein [Pseudonocardia kujensis]|uniref:Pls/PosA family non-ribosomal peptide synthetase n=1 Tax=Pseudonocardia kujensis TaxID=1128675 RepID=UPI001E533FD7|nr:Pls/PosA family non-ribosomal peptide synthetase [Pseudonocardia kujensis]MCE0763736.1 AMP-binding protein [Pseudonocardia kujensis]
MSIVTPRDPGPGHPDAAVRPRPDLPLSELVVVDRHEAQGWRVRRHERLDAVFEERCDWIREYGRAGQLAVDAPGGSLTYDELEARANRLARYLRVRGIGGGERVALLFDDRVDAYVAQLAVLAIGGTCVPLDPDAPGDRLAFVLADSAARLVLGRAHLRGLIPATATLLAGAAEVVAIDDAAKLIAEMSPGRLQPAERGDRTERPAYLVYVRGPGGWPAAVPIDHRGLCNAVRIASETFGLRGHRVHQGRPHFTGGGIEETWMAWVAGATLVPADPSLRGEALHAALADRRVTAWCTTPALLSTVEPDLPALRLLVVSGEPCPPPLVARWHRPGRSLRTAYVPDGAMLAAAWAEPDPDAPAAIGVPLPTYAAVVLDPDFPLALGQGRTGEVGLAGLGLACGYRDRGGAAVVEDFLDIPGNPSGRIHRTGDLGRVDEAGRIEYRGRLARQVDLRGERVDLTAVEATMLAVPGVAAAVATVRDLGPGEVALVGYYTCRTGAKVDDRAVRSRLRERAPGSHVPAVLVRLDDVPVGPDGHVDRAALPAPGAGEPTPRRSGQARTPQPPGVPERCVGEAPGVPRPTPYPRTAPDPGLAAALADVLAEVLAVEHVPTDRNVFDDLGADSMVMTRFCARLRKRSDLPSIAIKDVYAHPTLAGLAAAVGPVAPETHTPASGAPAGDADVYATPTIAGMAAAAAGPADDTAAAPPPSASAAVTPVRHSTGGYLLTGVLQLLIFLLYVTGTGVVLDRAYLWISTSVGLVEIYLRALTAGAVAFLALALMPIVAKWVLIGRWKETEFPVWSLRYVRFWLVKTLVRGNPLVLLMVGSPLYTLYLRLLGAKVGRDVVILTRFVPICTDLISVGAGTVVRKDAYLLGYRAHAGKIQQGPVTLGRDVVVGEKCVLDVGTAMGDRAQLGHASSLHRGQRVPAGERWHGSPPVPTRTDFRAVPGVRVRRLRRVTYVTSQLVKLFAIYLPLGFGGLFLLLTEVPRMRALLAPGAGGYTTSEFYLDAVLGSVGIVFGGLLLGLAVVFTVPRLLAVFVRPDRVYPVHGIRYSLHRTVTRLTNVKLFVTLFGDSSYIVGYLFLLGYDLGKVEQTGSNFGSLVAHETPFLASVGTGTVIADGLSVNNADFSNTSFRTSRVVIGARNFLGNHVAYPVGGRTGDDCLLATKVGVPIDGPVREGVGLLGSPAFEIPRTVRRDRGFEIGPEERRRLLRRKNAHNALTIALALLVRWGHVFGLLLLAMVAVDHYADLGAVAFAAEVAASVLFSLLWFIFWERAVVGFRRIRPKSCSIYDVRFWRHERYWKLTMPPLERLLAGTPYHNLVARMLGLRIGRRVFDDGASITERTMTAVGDDCSLNIGSIIQCHSQEDGAFKSDRSTLGAGVTLGVGTLVHYGVSIGDAVEVEPDSFVMKGEEVPAGARWGGNPAQEVAEPASSPAGGTPGRVTVGVGATDESRSTPAARRSALPR